MSGKFSNTATTFGGSNLVRQEDLIREIVQNEFYILFEDIKIEIETKIKSIDKHIIELRQEVHSMKANSKQQSMAGVLEKLQKIEAEMQLLRYQQQFQIRSSRAKSFEKERKPIFKRDSGEHEDFGNIILGLQKEVRETSSQKRILEKKELNGRPPLPINIDQSKYALPLESCKSQSRISKGQSKVRSNPVLQDSSSIHKWLQENNNKQASCFHEIIRQEDIQQSVFY